jgi:hypothetical protein
MQPNELAQMRAEMLMRQDPNLYDDGASQLGISPYMQQVGLFGKGKPKPVAPPIDIQRRAIFGLKPQEPMPANLPAVRSSDVPVPSAVPVPSQGPHPDVWAGGSFATNADFANVIKKHLEARRAENAVPEPIQPAPLTQLANKALNAPISRREVLKKAGQVALNQALPTPKVADVVPEIVSPLAQAANIVQPGFIPNDTIDMHLRNYVQGMATNAYEQEPGAVAQGLWIISRDYLKDRLPKETVQEFDTLANLTKQGKLRRNSPELSDEASHELFIRMQNNMRKLKPHELADVLSNLHQEDYPNDEIYENIADHFSNTLPENAYIKQRNEQLGLKPKNAKVEQSFKDIVDMHEFERYLDQSYEQAQKEKKAAKKEDE